MWILSGTTSVLSVAALVAPLSVGTASAVAGQCVFNPSSGPGVIAADDRSCDGNEIIVDGTSLTVTGQHAFGSLTVINGGVVRHEPGYDDAGIRGMWLIISGDCVVDDTSFIDANARGAAWGTSPGDGRAGENYGGGGAFGGEGGNAPQSGAEGGTPFGPVTAPYAFGGAGSPDPDNGIPGAIGGGAVRLEVGGTFTLDGVLRVNGSSSNGSFSGGGGAGGSVWITAGSLVGATGQIQAVGGGANTGSGGAGSGGRVAIETGDLDFDLARVRTDGGNGWSSGLDGGDGAAGTTYVAVARETPILIIDNFSEGFGRMTVLSDPAIVGPVFVGDLVVTGNALAGPAAGHYLDLEVTGDVLVGPSSEITADGRGLPWGDGPGDGSTGINYGGGAGHGGEGGNAPQAGAEGGSAYGSVLEPVDFGSAGGPDSDNGIPGALGGGAMRLIVGGTLTVEGFIDANGYGANATFSGGGGSGGSIWIQAGTIAAANGQIRSIGGGANTGSGGAGSGGRVAMAADVIDFDLDRVRADGGNGWSSGLDGGDGAAGTLHVAEAGQRPMLIVDNAGGGFGRMTILSHPTELGPVFDGDLIVTGNGLAGPSFGVPLVLEVTGDVIVGPNAEITADGRSDVWGTSPGDGSTGANYGGGGGHGGEGGNAAQEGAAGGGSYGSALQPTTLGSSGAPDPDNGIPATRGGGAIRLIVGDTLFNDGLIDANGYSANGSFSGGGGSGGSIWIQADTIAAGNGQVRAIGGSGNTSSGAAGAGGRIAFEANVFEFDIDRARADGGNAWSSGLNGGDGGAGTIFVAEAGRASRLIIDNFDEGFGRMTVLSDPAAVPPVFEGDLIIRGNANAGPAAGVPLDLTVTGDVVVGASSYLTASGRSAPWGEGPGDGQTGANYGGGGGYGGDGGSAPQSLAVGGQAYGSVFEPTSLGSSGAPDPDNGSSAAPGGGAIRLVVGGTLVIDGFVTSNGSSANTAFSGGGGSGGSIWLDAVAVDPSIGQVQSVGGNGNTSSGAAGSGGRIRITSGSVIPATLRANTRADGGDAWSSGILGGDGAAGTIVFDDPNGRQLLIDNLGASARITTFGSRLDEWSEDGAVTLDADILIRNGGIGGPAAGEFVTFAVGGGMEIAGNGLFTGTGQGFPAEEGPGVGEQGVNWGGGSGHAGAGGDGRSDDPFAFGGPTYGIAERPTTLGSGGVHDPNTGVGARAGGGGFRLVVEGVLDVGGAITSDGLSASGNEAGGASAGSIWIEAASIIGPNVIRAGGGAGNSAGGGGGGGYLAVFTCDLAPTVQLSVAGGGTGSGNAGDAGQMFVGSGSVNIVLQPTPESEVEPGDQLLLVVSASGNGVLSYQWRKDGQPLVDDGRIIGAQGNVLIIDPIESGDDGVYDVLVMDLCGPYPSDSAVVTLPNPCPTDLDGSGQTDFTDLVTVLNAWGPCDGECLADINGDGAVSFGDLILLLGAYGPCEGP